MPIFDHVHKGFGEVVRYWFSLLRETGFMGQVECISLFRFVCQFEDQTEVGEIIGHVVSFLLMVDESRENRAEPSQPSPIPIWSCRVLTRTTTATIIAAPNGFHLSLRLRVTREARKGAWRPPSLFMPPVGRNASLLWMS